jgi:hypothetical protein
MTKTGVIIGAVVAACLTVAIGLILFYLFWYRRRVQQNRRQNRSSILTQGPVQAQPEDGIYVTRSADLLREHLTPFVVSPRSSRQTPPGLLPTTYRDIHVPPNSHESSDSKGSTSTGQTGSTLQPSEPPPLPDSKIYIFPNTETSRRPLRLREAPLSSPNVSTPGTTNTGALGDSGCPVKRLPTLLVGPLQRSDTVGHANVIQEKDGGEMNETTAYRVPPAYSQIPRC